MANPLPPNVIHLNANDQGHHGQRNPNIIPVPPPAPEPPNAQQQAFRPGAILRDFNMMPRMPPQEHRHPGVHGHHGHHGLPFQHPLFPRQFPAPMNGAVPAAAPAEPPAKKPPPLERRAKHGAEISDLRQDNLSEADARQILSTFVVIRMEKSINENDLDEVGKPLQPTWNRAIRTEETDVSQHEATRKVRELDKKTEPVVDKKAGLSTVVQRQIEKAQESLEKDELDERYEYVLAQFDSKTREIDERSPLFKTHGQKKDKDKKEKADKSKHSKLLERVSVTAYFRRVPRRDQNALKMLEEKKKRAKGEKEKEKEPAAKPAGDGPGPQPAPQPMPMHPLQFPPPQMMMPPEQGGPQVFPDMQQGQGHVHDP
ncbi:hypothetical protein THASP1DRAFT_33464, partial [Thamnocephalis sphaerospora]